MSQPRTMIAMFGLLLGAAVASAATTTHTVYVSAPGDQKILRVVVTVNETTQTVQGKPSVDVIFPKKTNQTPANFAPKALTFGPHGNLWVVSGNQILKVNPANGSSTTCYVFPTNAGDPTTPGDIRFHGNIPYITTETGVWRLNDPAGCTSLQKVVPQSLSVPGGVFFNLTGRLLFLDSTSTGMLFRKDPIQGSNPPFDACPSCTGPDDITPPGGLNSPIAIGTRGSHGFPSTDTTYVSAGGALQVLSCPSSSACSKDPSIPFGSDSPLDFEVTLAGRLLVATLAPPSGNPPKDVAKLFRVDPAQGNQKILLVNFADEKGQTAISSIFGVAVLPTSLELTMTYMGTGSQTKQFNCGNSLVDLTFDPMGQNVDATIHCQMKLPGEVNPLFSGEAAGASCVSNDWNNGFCTLYDVQLSPDVSVAKTVLITYVRKAEPLAVNPLVVSDFNNVTTLDYFLLGSLDPTDQSRRGGASVVTIADESIDNPAGFVAYRPQLGTSCANAEPVPGGTLPVRIDFTQSCTLGGELFLTVVCNANDPLNLITDIDETSVGGSNDGNAFRCDPATGGWVYNLDLDASGVPLGSCCAVSGWGSVGAATPLGYFVRP